MSKNGEKFKMCLVIQQNLFLLNFFLPFPPLFWPEWPSCHWKTSCRFCWTKSRSSTWNSPNSILKFTPLFVFFPLPSIHKGKEVTNYNKELCQSQFLSSAFPTAALVVSVTTHLSLHGSFIWTLVDSKTRHWFLSENQTGDEWIKSENLCQFGRKIMASASFVSGFVLTVDLCICEYKSVDCLCRCQA